MSLRAMRGIASSGLPGTVEYFSVGEGDTAHEVEHEPCCVLGDIGGAVARAVGGDDAVLCKGRHIDVIDSDRHARDDANARVRHGVCRLCRYRAELANKALASNHLRGAGVYERFVRAPDELDLIVCAPFFQDLLGFCCRAVHHVVQDTMRHWVFSFVYSPLIMRRRARFCGEEGIT